MVNGNYVIYGDRPSSDSEIVDDHVQTRTAERKPKKKARANNEHQHLRNLNELDNETDAVKFEKKIKEPRLLRYVPTTEVEEHFVTQKFETYDLRPPDEPVKRHAFTKKPKNPADGSINYAYSRSSSSCSSPNLPTISEHVEQYGTYRVRSTNSSPTDNIINGYDTKLDKYFSKPREIKAFAAKGSHPDSLYRVNGSSGGGADKAVRALRLLRWPLALFIVCVALAAFVYFLMPVNLDTEVETVNATNWEGSFSEAQSHRNLNKLQVNPTKAPSTEKASSRVSQCRSTRLALCRGVLPYDLAGIPATIGEVDVTSLLSQIEYLVSTNCSQRIRHFACALLEPECSPPPYPAKMPCYNFCKAIVDSCEGMIPAGLQAMFKCNQYSSNNCANARVPCYSRELMCGDGSCVPRDWVCDGTRDCPGGEDEAPCSSCEDNEYRCDSGLCITKRWLCDGYSDCPNGDDEHQDICQQRSSFGGVLGDELEVEPGEELAGSAPAPSIRKPNRLPIHDRTQAVRNGENDSSKELLMTSDSTNAFRHNYTRRPSLSRLTPYKRSKLLEAKPLISQTESNEETTTKSQIKSRTMPRTERITTEVIKEDSAEDINTEDLGLFGDIKKKTANDTESFPKSKQEKSTYRTTTEVEPSTEATRLGKSTNQFDKVIDGSAMLRKAAKEQQLESQNTKDSEEYDHMQYSAHASPCPVNELRCVDGRCITLAQLCDGTVDCSDHADEDNCFT